MGKRCENPSSRIKCSLNNTVRTMTFSKKYCPMTSLYKNFNLLKLTKVYKLELGKFMYQFHHRQLPQSFYDRFTKISHIHKCSTRKKYNSVYFKP